MYSLADFNACAIAQFMAAKLICVDQGCITIYTQEWGLVAIHENGGEANVTFEYLDRSQRLPTPNGIRVASFAFDFSIPYPSDKFLKLERDAEFANRLLFYLNHASSGVEELSYFIQSK